MEGNTKMIFGHANKAIGHLRQHSVGVTVGVKAGRYLVTVEAEWTELGSGEQLGIRHYKDSKRVTVEFDTLGEFFREAWEISGGFSSLGEAEGIDQVLLDDAMQAAKDQVSDLLLFGGAAHLEDCGDLVIDWDEVECRRLIEAETREEQPRTRKPKRRPRRRPEA